MPEFKIRFEGLTEHEQNLVRLEALLTDLRLFWPRVVPIAISWLSRQFESEGSFFLGEPWAPLTPEYARRKAIRYGPKPILSAEGDLRRAATSPRRTVSPNSLVLEILPYEKDGRTVEPEWFMTGTSGAHAMPARPLLAEELPHEAEAELDAIAERYVEENVRRLRL